MIQFNIPGILGPEKGITGLVCVFVDNDNKGVQFLKSRPVYPATSPKGKTIGRINPICDKQAGKKTLVVPVKGRVFIQYIP